MNKKHLTIINQWLRQNQGLGWNLEEPYITKKESHNHSSINLKTLENCCIEQNQLCLAMKGEYMIWLVDDTITISYEPLHPLFT